MSFEQADAGLSSTRHLETRDELRRPACINWQPRYRRRKKYNLAHQLRKAVTSVPLNVAEGCGSASNTEFARFLSYAYRSMKEVVTAVELCKRLFPSLGRERTQALIDEGNQISRMTYNLMRKIDHENNSR